MNNKILFYDYKDYFSSPETQLDFHLWHNLETTYHAHNYDSLSHFNRIFKKTMGKTPSEYRKDYVKMH